MARSRLFVAALLAVAAAAVSAASTESPGCAGADCLEESGGDELGLLQKGRGDALGLKDLRSVAHADECLHGGWLWHGFCRCVPGWTGSRCELEREFEPYQRQVANGGGQDVCGAELAIFPYNDEKVWGTAFVGWEDCAGAQQSPIDICTQAAPICPQNRFSQRSRPLGTRYVPTPANVLRNNGHNLEVVNDANDFGTLRLHGKVFTAQSYHFHTPSEHTVDGKAGAMEVHIVHTAADGASAVVGILFELGNESECLKPLPLGPEELRSGCHRDFGAADLACFDEQLSGPWWSYRGSLTTPPCTEGVSWVVMVKRATMSQQQLDGFLSAHQMNARPVQANGNTVTLNTLAPP